MITLAPEVCSQEVIDLILSHGIIISAGHSHATYKEAMNGFSQGINTVTHLFTAMSPLNHREPGLAGATIDSDKESASIIPDAHKVAFAALRTAKKRMCPTLVGIMDTVT